MDPSRYQAVKELFEELLELSVDAREARLFAVASVDQPLADEVRSLLTHAETRQGAFASRLEEPEAPEGALPARLGDYRVVRVAGRGGMGTVYEAEQEHPRRRVALKVVDPGLVTPQVLRRFELEAEVLGRLQHPGIAQVYEAGTFEEAGVVRPYFAMEFVEGTDLVSHVREIDVAGRVALLAEVAEAVHHAHQRGVIHRDIKPANVLVDASGRPKVLDFGVARVTEGDLQTATLQTSAGQLVGTVPYMSPEQAACAPEELDTRTDVYSLGVLAFEVLSGELPIDVRGRPLAQAVHAVQEEEPRRLSSVDVRYRGDLDTIVAKALQKEKNRRYASAAELADDLRRFLDDEPIVARPTSVSYQLVKFARRNKALVGGVGAGFLVAFTALTVALVVSLERTDRAREAERLARVQAARSAVEAAAAAIQLGRIPSARVTLEGVPEELRGWEWRHYHARLDEAAVLVRTEARVAALAFTAEDAQFLLLEDSGRLARHDARTGALVEEHDLGTPLVDDVRVRRQPRLAAFDRDATRVALLLEDRVRVVSTADGSLVGEAAFPLRPRTVALSPDGRFLAAGRKEGAWTWEVAEGEPRALCDTPGVVVTFAPDGLLLVHGFSDPTAFPRIFDLRADLELDAPMVWRRLEDAALLSGGRSVVAAATIEKYFEAFGDDRRRFQGHVGDVQAVAVHEGKGLVASGARDRTVRLWNLGGGEQLQVHHGHERPPYLVTFDHAGARLLSASSAGVRLFELEGASRGEVLPHEEYVYGAYFRPDGDLVTQSWRGRVRVWDDEGDCVVLFEPYRGKSRLAVTPDRSRVVRFHDFAVEQVDADWNVLGRRDLGEDVRHVAISADGARVAARTSTRVLVFEAPSFHPALELPVPDPMGGGYNRFAAVALAPDGATVAAESAPGAVTLWRVADGSVLRVLEDVPRGVTCLLFSPDGSRLASGSTTGEIRVWRTGAEDPPLAMDLHIDRVYAFAFSPDGTRLASGANDASLRLWDLEDGAQVAYLSGHTDYVYALDFSPDGVRLVSGSGDRTARIWDTRPRHAR